MVQLIGAPGLSFSSTNLQHDEGLACKIAGLLIRQIELPYSCLQMSHLFLIKANYSWVFAGYYHDYQKSPAQKNTDSFNRAGDQYRGCGYHRAGGDG